MISTMLGAATNYREGKLTLQEVIGKLDELSFESTDEERHVSVAMVIETYFEQNGKHMDGTSLEKLTDVLLAEDIKSQYKPNREYSFHSERQKERTEKRERPQIAAVHVAIDGHSYKPPVRNMIHYDR